MVASIINQKGGVGKTTSVVNIGVYLANAGYKVLLIDLDPQANLTSSLGVTLPSKGKTDITGKDNDAQTVYDLLIERRTADEVMLTTEVKNLSLLPSNIELSGAEVEMVSMMSRESVLKESIKSTKDKFDITLIDCPPSLGILTVNVLVASDKVLVPIQCEYFALEGLGQLMNSVKLVKTNLNPSLEVGGVMLTMFDTRTNLSRDVANEVRNFFGDTVFKTIIPRNIRLSEAPSHGQSIYEYDAQSTGAKAYEDLAQEIEARFLKK